MKTVDELLAVLQDIRDGINSMALSIENLNESVNDLKGFGLYNSISDVNEKLDSVSEAIDDLKGSGLYNTVTDVCDKLDSISSTLDSIDISVS